MTQCGLHIPPQPYIGYFPFINLINYNPLEPWRGWGKGVLDNMYNLGNSLNCEKVKELMLYAELCYVRGSKLKA